MKGFLNIILIATILISTTVKAQDYLYDEAYKNIHQMLEGKKTYSFKDAVFEVENAYKEGLLDTIFINHEINFLKGMVNSVISSRKLENYEYSDKDTVLKYASLYTVMRDSIHVIIDKEEYDYIPFTYDFNDIWGDEDWSNMFVSKLLLSGKGNCHSLPYLYKILAEEIGVEAYLALAPNHIYIKHRNEKDGWYNTELTSGYFPIDAWIMASGYVHLDGIRNGLYMKALDDKESLALILVDLAQGFDKRFPDNDGSFVLKCVETALQYYPNMLNALLLKLETQRKGLERLAKEENKSFEEILDYPKVREIWADLTAQVQKIHELGYRQMPKGMYLDWLVSLKEEREKYANTKITSFEKPN